MGSSKTSFTPTLILSLLNTHTHTHTSNRIPMVFLVWFFLCSRVNDLMQCGRLNTIYHSASCFVLYFGKKCHCCFRLGWLNDHLFSKELFIRFTVRVFSGHLSVCVCASFPFGFECGVLDSTVLMLYHCLSFLLCTCTYKITRKYLYKSI